LADPKGKLARHINTKIDDLRQLLVEGTAEAPGLRQRIREYAKVRSDLRRQAIHSLEDGTAR
jgi:hypothetical protein